MNINFVFCKLLADIETYIHTLQEFAANFVIFEVLFSMKFFVNYQVTLLSETLVANITNLLFYDLGFFIFTCM